MLPCLSDTGVQTSERPLLELPTASSLTSEQLKRRERNSELSLDLARATISRHRPLWGLEDVSNALSAGLAGEDACSTDLTESFVVMDLLEQTAAKIPDTALIDLVYRRLCKLAIKRRSFRAAACASLLAFKLGPTHEAASRLRVLIFDVAFNFGNTAPDITVRLVAGILQGLPYEAVVFSRDGANDDPLQTSVRHALNVCLDKAKLISEYDPDAARCLQILEDLASNASEESHEKAGEVLSPWSAAALKAAMDSDDTDFAFNGTLALALEARMMGSVAAYDLLLREQLWPYISALSDLDGEDARDLLLIRRAVRALHVIGFLLAALGNSCSHDAWSSLENRVSNVMECNDLPLEIRDAAAEAMKIKTRELSGVCEVESEARASDAPRILRSRSSDIMRSPRMSSAMGARSGSDDGFGLPTLLDFKHRC